MASCVFANYLAMVLMHLPTDGLPPLQDFLPSLPSGLRAYAVYVLAHNAYLHKEYTRALGLCQSVFLMLDGCYPEEEEVRLWEDASVPWPDSWQKHRKP